MAMCPSFVAELDVAVLAGLLGLPRLLALPHAAELQRRVEAQGQAWVLRPLNSGRIVAEAMAYHPYSVASHQVASDPWAGPLLAQNHGLLVMRGFSVWVDQAQLVLGGGLGVHEIHCAFNRKQLRREAGQSQASGTDLLLNFHPDRPLLVPVLFDQAQPGVLGQGGKEFALLADQAGAPFDRMGIRQVPLGLSRAAAYDWLYAAELDPEADDCSALLHPSEATACSFALYKSA